MSAISLKSITGITSITTPAGVDNQLTLHNNNTTEAVKLDVAGNLHFHNHLNITGVSTASNFKTGTSNLHNTGLNVQDLDVDGHTNLDNVSIAGVTTFAGNVNSSGNITISNGEPTISLTDTDANPDYQLKANTGHFYIADATSGTRFYIDPNGTSNFQGNLNANKDFSVDGHTNLDNVSIAGVTTMSSTFDINGGLIKFGHCSSQGSDDTLMFGANGNDLQIFHGGNGQIDNNTGHIEIRNTGDFSSTREIRIRARVDENCINAYSDGAVKLYYDGGLQFETLTNGVKPTNNLFMNDNKPIYIGNSLDLQLYHDGNHSYINNSTGLLLLQDTSGIYIRSDDLRLQSAGGSETYATLSKDGAVVLNFDDGQKFQTIDTGVKIGTTTAPFLIESTTDGSGNQDIARMGINRNNTSTSDRQMWSQITVANNHAKFEVFARSANDTGTAGNFLSIDAVNGNVDIPRDSCELQIGASNDLKLYHNGSNSAVQNYQGALYISNKETNSSDLHLQGKTSIQMHCPSDGTIVQKIDANRLTTFDVGSPSSSNKTIARFQSESSRKLDVVWHDSGSYMGFDTPGNHPYMFKVNGTSALEINSYRETKTEESSHGWSTYEMHAKDGGTRFHYRGIGTGSSGASINLIRVRRHYWGSGFYHIKLRQRYYNGSAEGHWWLHGHGRSTGSYSPSWQLNHTNHNNLGGSKLQITSNSTSGPGDDYAGHVDVYANIGAYEYYEVVIETSLMAGYSHDVTSIPNDAYALHAF